MFKFHAFPLNTFRHSILTVILFHNTLHFLANKKTKKKEKNCNQFKNRMNHTIYDFCSFKQQRQPHQQQPRRPTTPKIGKAAQEQLLLARWYSNGDGVRCSNENSRMDGRKDERALFPMLLHWLLRYDWVGKVSRRCVGAEESLAKQLHWSEWCCAASTASTLWTVNHSVVFLSTLFFVVVAFFPECTLIL